MARKLTDEQVINLRMDAEIDGMSYPMLADRYDLCPEQVGRIVRRASYRHVGGPTRMSDAMKVDLDRRVVESQKLFNQKLAEYEAKKVSVTRGLPPLSEAVKKRLAGCGIKPPDSEPPSEPREPRPKLDRFAFERAEAERESPVLEKLMEAVDVVKAREVKADSQIDSLTGDSNGRGTDSEEDGA